MKQTRKKWLAMLLAALLMLGMASGGSVALRAIAQESEEFEETPAPEPDPTKAPTAAPTATPTPTPEPADTAAPANTDVPAPTETPEETATPEPTENAAPEESTEPDSEETDSPSETPDPDAAPDPDASVEPEVTPEPEPEEEKDESGLVIMPKGKYGGWYGVVPTDERGMAIPILYQYDYWQTVCKINGSPRSVATSGCGAVSASMVIAYLTGNTEQTPYTLFYRAVKTGHYYGDGLDHDAISWMLRENGVKCKWIYNNAAAIKQALREGKPVIAHMGPGIFTTQGHYIVLRGLTEDGKVLVNDPNSYSRTHKAYPIQTLLTQARESNSFLICWVDASEEEADSEAEDEIAVDEPIEPQAGL